MSSHVEGLEEMLDFIISFEDERMKKMSVLGSFEDDVGKMGEKGIEARFHIPDHLNFPGELIPEEVLDRLVGRWALFCKKFLVSGEDDAESIVRNLGSHCEFK